MMVDENTLKSRGKKLQHNTLRLSESCSFSNFVDSCTIAIFSFFFSYDFPRQMFQNFSFDILSLQTKVTNDHNFGVHGVFIYLHSRGKILGSEFPTPAYYHRILFKKSLHFCRMNDILAFAGSWDRKRENEALSLVAFCQRQNHPSMRYANSARTGQPTAKVRIHDKLARKKRHSGEIKAVCRAN